MRAMKDSGIEWIGEIPEDCSIVKIKNIITEGKDGIKIGPFGSSLANKTLDNGPYKIYGQANLVSGSFDETKHKISSQTFYDLQSYEVEPGDICISMMGTVGKCLTVPDNIEPGIMDSHLIKIRLNKEYTSRFFELFYDKDLGGICYNQIQYDKKGTIMDGLNTKVVKGLFICKPTLHEQQRITSFLDSKCSKIDSIVAKQQQLIEKLKEYKQSVITEAVTKGLNPDVPMKDSGIEWIGKIPFDWNVVRLKTGLSGIQDGTHSTFIREASGECLLSAKNVFETGIVIGDNESLISFDDYKSIIGNGYPKKDDILICCVGTIGRCCIYTLEKPLAFQRSVTFLRVNSKLHNKYLLYMLRSKLFTAQLDINARTSAQSGIYMGLLKELFIVLPNITEQQRVASYLDSKCSKIDSIIVQRQQLISKLQEYKKSLIYEVVTGKREVPNG